MSEVPELGIRLVPEGFDELLAKVKQLEAQVNAYLEKVEQVYKKSLGKEPPTREVKEEPEKEAEKKEEKPEEEEKKKEQTWTLKKILGYLGLGYISWRAMTKYSAYMSGALRTLDTFIGLILAPFLNILGAILMPFLIMMIEYVAVPFYKFMAPIAKWFLTDPAGRLLGKILGALFFIATILIAWRGASTIIGVGKMITSLFGGAGAGAIGGAIAKLFAGGGASLASTVPGWYYAGVGGAGGGGALASLASLGPLLALIGGMYAGGWLIKARTGEKLDRVLDYLYETREGPAKGVYGWARWFLGATKGTVFEPFGYFISGFLGMVTDISERIAGGVVQGVYWLGRALNPFKPLKESAEEFSDKISDVVSKLKDMSSSLETTLPDWAEKAVNDLANSLNDLATKFSSLGDELDKTVTKLSDIKTPNLEQMEEKLNQMTESLGSVSMPDLSALEELNKPITEVNVNVYMTIDTSKLTPIDPATLRGMYGVDLSSAIAEYYTEVSTRVGGRH